MLVTFLLMFAGGLSAQIGVDLVGGRKLFEGHCAVCHGQTGTGGRGPSLAEAKLKHGSTADDLVNVIRNGINGTEMPGAWQMTERELKQVAAFVQSLGHVPRAVLPGRVDEGRQIFAGKGGCGSCHIVRGEGTGMGPELSEIGARRSPEYLREALLNPGAAAPDGYLPVEITTSAGQQVKGQRVNEDSFTIQVQDGSGKYHSFRKSALNKLNRQTGQSTMPDYQGKFTAAEINDLIAYLASLRGER
ncbi:MAG TPA: c-type cytochrome [Bryobacteraceae bacterium]|nr:c-type cytochrome [Bryobacteraceae bacterium]